MNLKQNKGIGAADAIIAVAILVIFTGIIVSISYNIYNQSNFIKRNEQATKYIVELFEYAQGIIYEDLNSQVMIDYINNKYENTNAIEEYIEGAEKQAAYTILINVTDKYTGYIKQIDITVMYKLGGKNKTVNMKTLINK